MADFSSRCRGLGWSWQCSGSAWRGRLRRGSGWHARGARARGAVCGFQGAANDCAPATTALGITGAAYTNNDLNTATATTLFDIDIDTANDRVSLQSPANAGTLAPTGVNVGPSAGFDIYYAPSAGTNQGYAALQTSGTYGFYRVNILNGKADRVGDFPAGRQVFDVALPVNQDYTQPHGGMHTGGGAMAAFVKQ